MALLELKRSLLIPAILLAASLTLVGCAGGSTDNDKSDSSSNSTSNDDGEDEADDEDVEEADAEDAGGDYTKTNCPATFDAEQLGLEDFEVISPSEFKYPEVGLDILASGCLFSIVVEGSPALHQGYLPGGAAEIAEISASLEAAGFEEAAESYFVKPTGEAVAVYDSSTLFSAETVKLFGLGYGDSFIVVTGLS